MHVLIVATTHKELIEILSDWKKKKQSVGLVPTMGALHSGHLELLKICHEDCDKSVVSIFVNPKQFNNLSDYEKYPITLEADKKLLKENQCDLLFAPHHDEVYPQSFSPIKLDISELNSVFEGPFRPGHFDGVIQVVHRLFQMLEPQKAFFGLKDFQQCLVINRLKQELHPKLQLVFCSIIREESGLAMSSRNRRLSDEGLNKAALIYKSMLHVKNLFQQVEPKDALGFAKYLLEQASFEIEYLDLANSDSLKPMEKWQKKGKNVVLAAVWLEGIRLIDNVQF